MANSKNLPQEESGETTSEETVVSRRRFLTSAIGAILAFIGTALGIPIAGFVASPALTKKRAESVQLGPPEDFKVNQPRMVEFSLFRKDGWIEKPEKKSVWVVRKSDSAFVVYNARCTHLGCLVNWKSGEKGEGFYSPCHGGVFTINGDVVAGPPPRPLDQLVAKVENGKLVCEYKDFRLGVPYQEEI